MSVTLSESRDGGGRAGSPFPLSGLSGEPKGALKREGKDNDGVWVIVRFGRQVNNMSSENSESALVKLMEIFNHSAAAITNRYHKLIARKTTKSAFIRGGKQI